MHNYMRAIGFSKIEDRKQLKKMISDIVRNATERAYTSNGKESVLAEFSKDFAENIGVTVCGEFDETDKFTYDYYYPYIRGTVVSTNEDVSVERHAAEESYAGICDDIRVGVSLIFYLQNMIPYVKAQNVGLLPVRGTTLTLSGLSLGGTVMMPIIKNETDKKRVQKATINRSHLIEAARKGDEDAMESLTLEDMDTYTIISRRIQTEDVFTLVDTYFMPYGVECDQYSILGEILECNIFTNQKTKETVYRMLISCNDLQFDICINTEDLVGEPQAGRRFKGTVWMQGYINFPE